MLEHKDERILHGRPLSDKPRDGDKDYDYDHDAFSGMMMQSTFNLWTQKNLNKDLVLFMTKLTKIRMA